MPSKLPPIFRSIRIPFLHNTPKLKFKRGSDHATIVPKFFDKRTFGEKTQILRWFEFLTVFFMVLALNSLFPQQTEESKLLAVLQNLKVGWETKNVDLLKTCFNPLPPLQIQTYQELFKIAKEIKVEIRTGEIKYNGDFASVDAQISQSYALMASNGQLIPKSSGKHVAYVFKKSQGIWSIAGIIDYSKVNTSLNITPNNIGSINKVLSNFSPESRALLANQGYQMVSASQNKVTWQSDLSSYQYVVSLADQDLTKVPSANLLWKVENVKDNFAYLPTSVISAMATNRVYFLHVFSYDSSGKALKGQIFQIAR